MRETAVVVAVLGVIFLGALAVIKGYDTGLLTAVIAVLAGVAGYELKKGGAS